MLQFAQQGFQHSALMIGIVNSHVNLRLHSEHSLIKLIFQSLGGLYPISMLAKSVKLSASSWIFLLIGPVLAYIYGQECERRLSS